MDGNTKKKKPKHYGRAVLSNFQNKKGFSPLRKALLEQTVKKIVGKNASDYGIEETESPEEFLPQTKRQIPAPEQKERKKKRTLKNAKFSAEPTGYLEDRKHQLQKIYFTRKQIQQMARAEESSQDQPNTNFRFSPQTITSSPIPDILESLRETRKTPLNHKVSVESPLKICPYCGRDFPTTNNIQMESPMLKIQNCIGISPNLNFTYYPRKF